MTHYITTTRAIRCAYKVYIDAVGGDSGGPVFYYDYFGHATAIGIMYDGDGEESSRGWFAKWNGIETENTGSFPAPSWIRVTANDVIPNPTASIVGPTEMPSGSSCYWYVATNFAATDFEWRVNGQVVGTAVDLTYSASSSFVLSVQATGGGTGNGATQNVTVSSSAGQCFVQ